ncbi:MAG: hypothetical protein WDZ51_10455 [Pirellulaceae bacterium]
MIFRILLVTTITACCTQSASAQYWGGGHASTAQEGAARGMADVVRSAGMYNLATSEAAINVETARAQYIENRNRAQEVYFERRRRNESYREENRRPRVTSEQIFRMNSQRAPSRLSSAQLDPLTGELQWPFILLDDPFDGYRSVLDEAFMTRAQHGSFASVSEYQHTLQTANDLFEALRGRIRDFQPQEYLQASTFMEALIFDAQFPSN